MDPIIPPKKTAWRSFLIVILIIFLVEVILMGAFRLFLESDNIWIDVILDAGLLAFFQFPSLYYFMVRPLQREIEGHRLAENELRKAKELLEIANGEIQKSLEREQVLARTDGLTGLYNYRHFFELASREFSASQRYQRPLAIIIFDTDRFKQVNDTLGHLAGDKMLVKVAETVAGQMRSVDVLARYGGDEFIILLPETSAQQAFHIAERIRSVVAATPMGNIDTGQFFITLSIGVAEIWSDPLDHGIEQIVHRADQALYAAKQAGRDRVMIFQPG
ncbi:MAG: diguanylate cyclase [Chloroflexi bacterium]|nr:diguanylate cyclase [Chloroflexota bacterium]